MLLKLGIQKMQLCDSELLTNSSDTLYLPVSRNNLNVVLNPDIHSDNTFM